MEFIESEIAATRGRKPRDDARRTLLAISSAVLDLSDKITKKFKDTKSIDDTLDKCIAGRASTQPWKELCELAAAVNEAKAIFNDARRAEEKRKEREAKAAAKAAAAAQATAQASAVAAPIVNVIVNNYNNVRPEIEVNTGDARISHVQENSSGNKNKKQEKPKKAKIGKEIREHIWEKYIGDKAKADCPVCQKRIIRSTDFSAGHIVAESCGGATDVTNLVPICCNCNSRMYTENLYDYTRRNFGRDPVFAAVPTMSIEEPVSKPANVIKHAHCRAISGSEVESKKFESDEEAIAYALSKKYTAITHKEGSNAAYYFTVKPDLKFRIAENDSKGAWGFTSWEFYEN